MQRLLNTFSGDEIGNRQPAGEAGELKSNVELKSPLTGP